MYIGIDDTDSSRGMCTTYLALEVIRALRDDMDLIGHPRLVRLNPNIPWKTRGNAAIALRFGKGKGRGMVIGEVEGEPVEMWPEGRGRRAAKTDLHDVLDRVVGTVRWFAHIGTKGTNSAVVVAGRRPPRSLYWRAVREVVPISEARKALPKGTAVRAFGTGRGVVGAAAAIAWAPGDRTYEVLAYRVPSRWGTEREVRTSDVIELDERFPSTFNNYDKRNKHSAVVPGTPCPILVGIRGEVPRVLPGALASLRTEVKDRWVVFETNQATDDHMVKRGTIPRHHSGIVRGIVAAPPIEVRGGHVLIDIKPPGGRVFTGAAYEPTKEFRNLVRLLRPGDRVTVHGSRTATNPGTVNIEKITIERLMECTEKVHNPPCPSCGKAMKSMGRGVGFRCRRCGTRAPLSSAAMRTKDRGISPGIYEVPICARRHLHRPLRRSRKGGRGPP